MSPLRIYHPSECNEAGVPLDWDDCRACAVVFPSTVGSGPCETCDDHGSLKEAALAHLRVERGDCPIESDDERCRRGTYCSATHVLRCEDCGHPMSEGTWEGEPPPDEKNACFTINKLVLPVLRDGGEPEPVRGRIHYSPCDEGCRHGGPGRFNDPDLNSPDNWTVSVIGQGTEAPDGSPWLPWFVSVEGGRAEASWRSVDIRTLSFTNILLPEFLAVLCLRCSVQRGTL